MKKKSWEKIMSNKVFSFVVIEMLSNGRSDKCVLLW